MVFTVEHTSAGAVIVGAEQACGAAHDGGVGRLVLLAACSAGCEEVVVAVVHVEHAALEVGRRELHLLGAGLDGESVGAELDDVEAAPVAAPGQEETAVVLDEEVGVDAVVDADFARGEQFAQVLVGAGDVVGDGDADAALVPEVAHPLRVGVVHHIFVADAGDVGRPEAFVAVPGGH